MVSLCVGHECFNVAPQLAAVHLVDAHHCSDASRFISVLMLSLQAMLQLELPHVNVLSKADLAERASTSMRTWAFS